MTQAGDVAERSHATAGVSAGRPWSHVEPAVDRLSAYEAAAKAWQSVLQAERSRPGRVPGQPDEVELSLREHRKRLRGAKKLRVAHPQASPELELYLEALEADQIGFELALAEVVAATVSNEAERRMAMWRRLRARADEMLESGGADGRAFA